MVAGVDLNHRPLGYEPNELPGCSTPHFENNRTLIDGQIAEEPHCSMGAGSLLGSAGRKPDTLASRAGDKLTQQRIAS